MDTIFLEGIELPFHVGVTPEERAASQPCALDLEISADLGPAGTTGELSRTIDYAAIYSQVEKLSRSRSFILLEEIAVQVADLVLEHPLATHVWIRIRKLQPFTPKVKSVGVEISKSKK